MENKEKDKNEMSKVLIISSTSTAEKQLNISKSNISQKMKQKHARILTKSKPLNDFISIDKSDHQLLKEQTFSRNKDKDKARVTLSVQNKLASKKNNLKESNEEKTQHVLIDTNEKVTTSLPKKRGRPKKILGLNQSVKLILTEKEKVVSSPSKQTGRKRRNVNYYDLANPKELEDSNTDLSKKRSKSSMLLNNSVSNNIVETTLITEQNLVNKNENLNTIPQLLNTKESETNLLQPEGNTEQITRLEGNENIEKEDIVCCPQINMLLENCENGGHNIELSEPGDLEVGVIDRNNIKFTSTCLSSDQSSIQKFESGEQCINENATNDNSGSLTVDNANWSTASAIINNNLISTTRKRYNKTGATAAMMGALFSMFKNETQSDTWTNGRLAQRVLSDDNAVACAEHNKSIHHNLVWRVGDKPLDIKNSVCSSTTNKNKQNINHKVKCDKTVTSPADLYTVHQQAPEGSRSSNVTCAVCNLVVAVTKWSYHKQRQHNNLAWRVGEKPLDLNNQSIVMSILNALYKNKKPLYCSKCGTSKKSVVGFLSHQSMCMKSKEELEDLKEKCEFCTAKILPVSMQHHIKQVHMNPTAPSTSAEKSDGTIYTLQTKRSSAKKALTIINEFGKEECAQESSYYTENLDFKESELARVILERELLQNKRILCKFNGCSLSCTDMKTFFEHVSICKEKPTTYFICNNCLLVCGTEMEIVKHIQTSYDVRLKSKDNDFEVCKFSDNDEMDENMAHVKKKSELDPKYKIKPQCIANTVRSKRSLFQQAYKWTLEFCQENFNNVFLHNHIRNELADWPLVEVSFLENFLPPLFESCDVARTIIKGFENCLAKDYDFKRIDLFESQTIENGESIIFCGGPISAMAWLPTPYTMFDANQILAVSTLTDPDKNYLYNTNYCEKSIIQFWNFGPLRNRVSPTTEPKLAFSFIVDYAPVWHLEWCPSGCYETQINGRIGLLAVAASDAVVYIYSVPVFTHKESGLFYKDKPMIKLLLSPQCNTDFSGQYYYATKISWSKAAGHNYICVGYTNGFVALFNINTDSKLVKKIHCGVKVLTPYKYFQAHGHYITVLHLHHLNGGNRWLLTGSFDKNVLVWDLETNTKITSWKKNVVSDGLWFTNWLTCLISADESSHSGIVHTSAISVRSTLSETTQIINCSVATISSITASDWLNLVIQGNTTGEIVCVIANQLLYSFESDKSLKNSKYLLGYTELIEKGVNRTKRVREEDEKLKALKNTLKTKTEIDSTKIRLEGEEEDLSHLHYNPHYYKYEPLLYQQTQEKYGLIFCDLKMDSYQDFHPKMGDQLTPQSPHYHISKPNLYKLHAVNKVAVNPNMQASTFYATGYQAGFLRLTCMRFLNTSNQVV